MKLAALSAPAAFAAVALAIASTAGAAASAPAPASMQAAFGNTIVSTYPDGRTGLLWLKEDGTYTAKGRRRTSSSGTWSVKANQVCLKQKKPVGAPFSYCTALPSSETWSAKAVTGEPIKVKVVKGIQEP
ncbi:MAG: hypothetical protein JWM33_2303 [Caulobacteraceae bacterium]|nr:hypothetical protein [Caulobacteraceae bacterium]